MLEGFITLAQAAAGEAGNTAAATAQAAAATAQAAAQPAAAQQASGWESIMSLLPMIIIIVAMFYLMYRGQKKEQKQWITVSNFIKIRIASISLVMLLMMRKISTVCFATVHYILWAVNAAVILGILMTVQRIVVTVCYLTVPKVLIISCPNGI